MPRKNRFCMFINKHLVGALKSLLCPQALCLILLLEKVELFVGKQRRKTVYVVSADGIDILCRTPDKVLKPLLSDCIKARCVFQKVRRF